MSQKRKAGSRQVVNPVAKAAPRTVPKEVEKPVAKAAPKVEPKPKPTTKAKVKTKSIDQVAAEVIRGLWQDGRARDDKLRAAGYNPVAVLREVAKQRQQNFPQSSSGFQSS